MIYVTVHNSKHLFFDDDLTYHNIRNVSGRELLQSDTDSVQSWYSDIGMNLNFGKSVITSFTCKSDQY